MAYGESNGHVTDSHMTLKGQTRDPDTILVHYLENSWRQGWVSAGKNPFLPHMRFKPV